MSKNNMLLGYARGKVGSLVFNRLKGQQITKAHNASPANPKSYAQMAQRCRYNTAVARYKMATRKFFKFAYEDKRPHESDFNAFMRHNMMAEPFSTKAMVADGEATPANIMVSSGSIPTIPFASKEVDLFNVQNFYGNEIFYIGLAAGDFETFLNASFASDDRIKDLSKAFLLQFPFLQNGDLLTGVYYACDASYYYSHVSTPSLRSEFGFTQFKIDVGNVAQISSLGKNSLIICDDDDALCLSFGLSNGSFDSDCLVTFGIIVTRKDANCKVLASDCTLTPNTMFTPIFNNRYYKSQNADAIASYSPTTPAILNPDK